MAENLDHVKTILFLSFYLLPMAPVGFKETLDGWPPPVSRAGQIF